LNLTVTEKSFSLVSLHTINKQYTTQTNNLKFHLSLPLYLLGNFNARMKIKYTHAAIWSTPEQRVSTVNTHVAFLVGATNRTARLPPRRRSGFPPGTAQPVLRTVGEPQRFGLWTLRQRHAKMLRWRAVIRVVFVRWKQEKRNQRNESRHETKHTNSRLPV